jgi:hypothetical protein
MKFLQPLLALLVGLVEPQSVELLELLEQHPKP